MNLTKLAFFIVALGCSVLAACSVKSPNESSRETHAAVQQAPEAGAMKTIQEKHSYLEVELVNNTRNLIDQTSISFGTNQCTFGMLGSGGGAMYLGWLKAVGTNAVVRWREVNASKLAEVDLSKVYDPTKAGTLHFTILGTNVAVSFTQIPGR